MTCRLSVLLAAVALMACPGPAPKPPDAGHDDPPDAGQQVPQDPPDAGPQNPPDAGPQLPPDAGPPPLLELEGELELGENGQLPVGVRVGMLWFPGLDPTLPAGPRAAVSGPELTAASSRWKLDVLTTPPPEARINFSSPGGGDGSYSIGVLVLYRDLDGDGALSVSDDGSSTDELLGSSANAFPFDVELDAQPTLVVWREGTIGNDETGFVAGFNLATINGPFSRPSRLPNAAALSLRLAANARPQLMVCPAAFAPEPPEFACGQLVYLSPRVTASLMSVELFGSMATIEITSGQRKVMNARVTLNGSVLSADADGNYLLLEPTPGIIRTGVNELRVETPDLQPVEFEVMLPAAPSMHTPTSGGVMPVSSSVTVAWQAVTGATSYDVSLFLDVGGEAVFETTTATHLDLNTPATAGAATLSVAAMTQGNVGRHLSLGSSNVNVPVQLVSP